MPNATLKKRIKNPADNSQYVDLSIVGSLNVADSSGPTFQRSLFTFVNAHASGRIVTKKTVTHKARLEGDNPDDPSQTLDVEVLKGYVTTSGSGPDYEKSVYALSGTTDPDNTTRKTHVVRIENDDDADIWIDVRRIDQFTTTDGSGPTFQRTITTLIWDDDKFDSFEGDPASTPVGDGFDPPWRLDPFQEIISVNWGGVYVLLFMQGNDTHDGTHTATITFPDGSKSSVAYDKKKTTPDITPKDFYAWLPTQTTVITVTQDDDSSTTVLEVTQGFGNFTEALLAGQVSFDSSGVVAGGTSIPFPTQDAADAWVAANSSFSSDDGIKTSSCTFHWETNSINGNTGTIYNEIIAIKLTPTADTDLTTSFTLTMAGDNTILYAFLFSNGKPDSGDEGPYFSGDTPTSPDPDDTYVWKELFVDLTSFGGGVNSGSYPFTVRRRPYKISDPDGENGLLLEAWITSDHQAAFLESYRVKTSDALIPAPTAWKGMGGPPPLIP